jgi:hypothetical protein
MRKEHKGIALASGIRLGSEEGLHELWCVRDEVLKLAVDRIDCKYGVFADVRVAVLQAGSTGGDE